MGYGVHVGRQLATAEACIVGADGKSATAHSAALRPKVLASASADGRTGRNGTQFSLWA
jgi:predicted amino acid dehydrogenase